MTNDPNILRELHDGRNISNRKYFISLPTPPRLSRYINIIFKIIDEVKMDDCNESTSVMELCNVIEKAIEYNMMSEDIVKVNFKRDTIQEIIDDIEHFKYSPTSYVLGFCLISILKHTEDLVGTIELIAYIEREEMCKNVMEEFE